MLKHWFYASQHGGKIAWKAQHAQKRREKGQGLTLDLFYEPSKWALMHGSSILLLMTGQQKEKNYESILLNRVDLRRIC